MHGTNMPSISTAHPIQRYLRFSVRGLIALVLVIGAALGCLVASARRQHAAVVAIERAGGTAGYDLGWTDNPGLRNGGTWAPSWMVESLGIDFFVSVIDVAFAGNCGDRELAYAGSFRRLEQLSLARSRISDAGLVHLERLSHLSWLSLLDTRVTDDGLVHLEGLTGLSELDLAETRVTDAGLTHLHGLSNLSELDLSHTKVTEAGTKALKRARPNLTIYQ